MERGSRPAPQKNYETRTTRKLEELEKLEKLESFYPSALRAPPLPKVGEELLTPQILEKLVS